MVDLPPSALSFARAPEGRAGVVDPAPEPELVASSALPAASSGPRELRAHSRRRFARALPAVMLSMIAVKLAWVAGAPMFARWAIYDDALFVRQASTISRGEWLGPYQMETLMKGPMYPLFIAACHALRIPLSLAQHLLHAAVCVLAVVAFRRVVEHTWILLLPFALCLFDPSSFGTGALAGVSREGIYSSLGALVLISAAAMVVRRDGPVLRLTGWAVLLGVALGAFWLTREEGPWLLPSVALLAAAGIGMTLRSRLPDLPLRLAAWLLPFALCGAMVLGICAINHAYYGVFVVDEIEQPEFTAAYGALARVGQAHFQPYNVLPREERLRLYELSPAFRELQPFLEGESRKRWEGCGPLGKRVDGEIFGGWFLWALRDAVTRAGRADSAPEARAYYARLAEEVDAACEQGLIDCGPPRSSLIPPWNSLYRVGVRKVAREALAYLVSWGEFSASVPPSTGSDEQLDLFREMTGCTMTLPRSHDPGADPSEDSVRARVLERFGSFFQHHGSLLVLAALVAWVFQWFVSPRRRSAPFLLVTLALLLAIAVRLGLLVYIDLTSFPALRPRYMAPLSPLLLLFCGFSLSGLVQALALRLRARAPRELVPRRAAVRSREELRFS